LADMLHYILTNPCASSVLLPSRSCYCLAAKVVDHLPLADMLRYLLSLQYGRVVSPYAAQEVEARCLAGLSWRLGPFFSEDVLGGD